MKSRLMKSEDIEKVYEIENQCFSMPWSKHEIMESFSREDSIYCVIEKDDVVIGYAALFFVLDEANIINIGINNEYRGIGAGEELLKYLINNVKGKNVSKIFLEVREGNHIAVKLYEKIGFKEIGIRKNFYQNPLENGIVMSYTI